MKKTSRTLDVKIEIVIRNWENDLQTQINNFESRLVREIFVDMLKSRRMLGKEFISDYMLDKLWEKAEEVALSQVKF